MENLKGKTWVTRRGVKVDRTATAWLIRRFIDPEARIRFVDPANYTHADGELRFDMSEGEFKHQGELCTFESLLGHIERQDPALAAIGEMVHDLDLKERKYGRPETEGVRAMIAGIVALYADDDRRMEDATKMWDAIYAGLGGRLQK